MNRKHLNGDFFRHFERIAQGRRCRVKQASPKLSAGKLVESEIAAHDRECFGVFAQTLGFKPSLRKFTSRQIAVPRINLTDPAWVLPRTGPDKNLLFRK